ncbi:MAG TPA: phosphatase PAP2 family protein, partial [Dehalococcoidia bacterium]
VIGLGLYMSTRSRSVRLLAMTLTPAMWLATVVTGNHFFIDGIFGTMLAGIAFLVAFWLQRHWPHLQAVLREKVRSLRQNPAPT